MTGPAPAPAPTRGGGRRAAARPRRRVGVAVVLAVLVPLGLVGAATGLVPEAPRAAPATAPDRVDLGEQTLLCPPPGAGGAPVVVGRVPGAGTGEVAVTGAGGAAAAGEGDSDAPTVDVPDGGTGTVDAGSRPAVVVGVGAAAPGLLAARVATDDTAAALCLPPAADQWFTGLGAGPEHSSIVDLVNPETGPAVVDLTLHGADGPLDVPDVAGVTVPPGERVTLDLAEIVPTAEDLAAQVQVVRGRVGVTVLDRETPVAGAASSDWLAPQPEPTTRTLLPGLVGGPGERTLVVANPGSTDTQVDLQVATPGGPVTPVGVPEIQVPAGGVRAVEVGDELGEQVDAGGGGLLLTSAAPVTATLRSVVRDDLALTAAVPAARGAASIVPEGDTRVALSAPADQAVDAEVVALDADGAEVGTEQVEVEPGGVVEVDLPADARLVTVDSDTDVASAVVVRRGEGTVVLGLRPPVTDALVPAVRPGMP